MCRSVPPRRRQIRHCRFPAAPGPMICLFGEFSHRSARVETLSECFDTILNTKTRSPRSLGSTVRKRKLSAPTPHKP